MVERDVGSSCRGQEMLKVKVYYPVKKVREEGWNH